MNEETNTQAMFDIHNTYFSNQIHNFNLHFKLRVCLTQSWNIAEKVCRISTV